MDSLEELVQQLSEKDIDRQGLALGALVKRGKTAVPLLLNALHQGSAQVRALAAEGLGKIADLQTADDLFAAVNDKDEQVRSQAAIALAKLKDPRALEALIRTLNDNEDELHTYYSLSAYTLRTLGPMALPALVPLLKAEDEATRTKAIWVIRDIVSVVPGIDWPELWRSLGSYDPNSSTEARQKAADLWIEWIETNGGKA
jgi:HEAT repeat protein